MGGMYQIFRFNWPWYASALVVSALGCAVLPGVWAWPWIKGLVLAGMICALTFSASSLGVSHWVYDCSVLRQWTWIKQQMAAAPKTAVNIHAGFDETSRPLQNIFPNTEIVVWDIYRSSVMTEGSISRARAMVGAPLPKLLFDFTNLPADAGQLDAAFLLFTAHEIRAGVAREQLFSELFRILKPGGTVLITEHLRDWKNFLAFGPGFFHFLPAREWLRLARRSGFVLEQSFTITPFVHVFRLAKPRAL